MALGVLWIRLDKEGEDALRAVQLAPLVHARDFFLDVGIDVAVAEDESPAEGVLAPLGRLGTLGGLEPPVDEIREPLELDAIRVEELAGAVERLGIGRHDVPGEGEEGLSEPAERAILP